MIAWTSAPASLFLHVPSVVVPRLGLSHILLHPLEVQGQKAPFPPFSFNGFVSSLTIISPSFMSHLFISLTIVIAAELASIGFLPCSD